MFVKTKIVLTIVYVMILAGILASSSGVSRSIFSERLRARFDESASGQEVSERLPPPGPDMHNIQEDFQSTILMVNGALLIVAAILSYGLAGLTLRPIRSAYQRQRRFLGDASHELRTPLAILQTGLESQLRRNKDTKEEKKIKSHLEEVYRMTRLVEDLLQLSYFAERNINIPNKEDVQLVPLLRETSERFIELAIKNDITIDCFINTDAGVTVLGDKQMLSQAIANVLKNAVCHNKSGGSVEIRLSKVRSQAVIEIKDTGTGMNAEDLAHVFDRFYRAEKSRFRGTGGSGLGLSIAYAVICAHCGHIDIQSVPDKGTRVVITLPVSSAS
ncbi:MAG: Histidine kinase [Candidatus Uhrbacteria bacterium GW2011_GWE2_46_68]|uniref:histidine kinase n=2 Tax=Candidatus Uhriibacteriota TaxID=1752732 RepID=A0A0G1Q6H9_9BACT|nr:MAG: Histidine kinase [Candidatus Uhrbacteria bacterium GW2011_GWF2_46_218]KKU40432.1 MAG: Histidine kinase [Candidatus Uhrbacteria bacterium GW2011_GWE2_46_68]